MTRDEILNMPAGRKMDVQVHVAIEAKSDHDEFVYMERRLPPDGTHLVKREKFYDCPRCHDAEKPLCVPRYSTDITAAWIVWQKIGGEKRLHQADTDEDSYACIFGRSYGASTDMEGVRAEADAAPLAICRAALLAVMT
jgi:hypothetical protein